MALGLGDGFDKEMKTVAKDMENAIPTDFDADVQYTVGAAGGYRGAAFGGTSNAYNQSFTININVDHMDNDTDLNALATNLSGNHRAADHAEGECVCMILHLTEFLCSLGGRITEGAVSTRSQAATWIRSKSTVRAATR